MSKENIDSDVEKYRSEFESQMTKYWSFEMSPDEDGEMGYKDDLVQGAFIGWLIGKKIITWGDND